MSVLSLSRIRSIGERFDCALVLKSKTVSEQDFRRSGSRRPRFGEAPRSRGFFVKLGGAMAALEEVKDLAEAVARRRRLKLWDVEMAGQPGRSVVRVYIDGDDGVDLDTVAEVSDEISRGLDLRDPIPGRYTLEVSTP